MEIHLNNCFAHRLRASERGNLKVSRKNPSSLLPDFPCLRRDRRGDFITINNREKSVTVAQGEEIAQAGFIIRSVKLFLCGLQLSDYDDLKPVTGIPWMKNHMARGSAPSRSATTAFERRCANASMPLRCSHNSLRCEEFPQIVFGEARQAVVSRDATRPRPALSSGDNLRSLDMTPTYSNLDQHHATDWRAPFAYIVGLSELLCMK